MSGRDTDRLPTTASRPCWECLRRQTPCDATHPVCKTCADGGLVCPGYEDRRPLRWLPPGKVTSRSRKKGTRPTPAASSNGTASSTRAGAGDGAGASATRNGGRVVPVVARQGDVPCLSQIVLKVETDAIFEAVQYFNAEIYPPYTTVQHLSATPWLSHLPMETVVHLPPSLQDSIVFMALGHRIASSPESTDGQVVSALKTRMYDHLGKAIHAIQQVLDKERLRNSDYALSLVMMLLFGESRQCVSPSWTQHFEGASKMIELRGGLRVFLDHPYMRGLTDYFLLVGVMANTVSPASAQFSLACQTWLADIISEYYGDNLFPVLLCPTALFADIIRINALRAQAAAAAAAAAATSLPGTGATASGPAATGAAAPDLRRAAREVLGRVLAFCPRAWTDRNKDKHTPSSPVDGDPARLWVLLGHAYRSATALYCITSLRSVGLLPWCRPDDGDDDDEFEDVEARRSEHRTRLASNLREALVTPELKLWLLWPLVVAGMDAGVVGGGDSGDDWSATTRSSREEFRGYVRRELGRMAVGLGTPLPLAARAALERFWGRGGGRWDECFDRPYAFVT